MSQLIRIEDFDAFVKVKDVSDSDIQHEVLKAVQKLDERDEFEPFLRCILGDVAATPHGPAELADMYSHRLAAKGKAGMAAFILKGKSFPTVRPTDVSHQIYRLKKMGGLSYAVLASPGIILDQAKDQFCTTCDEEAIDYAILERMDLARLFVAYGFICPKDGYLISSGRCRCGYSPENRILNLLQLEALAGLQTAHDEARRTGLIVLPMGSGKTRVAAEDSWRQGAKRILFVAHTHEILDVAESEFSSKFGSIRVRRAASADDLEGEPTVTLATIQLLHEHLESVKPKTFDYLVIDEFHHAAARSYRAVIDHLEPNFLLGMTGTPERSDGQAIRELCDNVIVASYELRFGIEIGVLCPYIYYGCIDNIDYGNIVHNGMRYDVRDLERALIVPQRDKAVIAKWRELADGKPTVAFCCTITHAERVAKHFNTAGIDAAVYTSKTSPKQKAPIMAAFKGGETKVLCVVDVLNEGADLPFVECLLFLRPTESKRIFYQQMGRGLRKSPGKKHCLVIDFIGNFRNAHRIIAYQGLLPFESDDDFDYQQGMRNPKAVLNLPAGCDVHFEAKVVDLFARMANSFEFADRFNIQRMLLYQYDMLARRLQRKPTRQQIDRNFLVNSEIYATCWGSWKDFEDFVRNRPLLPPQK